MDKASDGAASSGHGGPHEQIRAPLQVEFLWWADCPSHEAGYALLQQALAAEGVAASITRIEVSSDDEAQRLAFIGSPSIRLMGEDIDPLPVATGARSPYALTCRAYRREDGQIAPLPTLDYVRAAIRRTLEQAERPS